jgi:HlyD family secretion protein
VVRLRVWLVGLSIATLLVSGCGARRPTVIESSTTPQQGAEQPTPLPPVPPTNVILVDGEMTNLYPPLELGFPGTATGELLAFHVQVGQRVKRGDLIATMGDGELQEGVEKAQVALRRAIEDKEKADSDAERTYQRELEDAEKRYQQALDDADKAYSRDRVEAERALERAQRELARAKMQPPTTAVTEAEFNLAQALDAQAQAEDDYKQALDRPWEPQRIRDSLYKGWQARIEERELAELRLQDARTQLRAYYLDLQAKEDEVKYAEADLEDVERQKVEREEVDREVSLTYDRAIEDARLQLVEAEAALDDARLYAPWDGLVLSFEVNEGTIVAGGTPVVTLLNVEALYFVSENLSERHVALLRESQQANITLRSYPDTVLSAQVAFVLPQLERVAEADARFDAYLRLAEIDLGLLPGMTGRVEIVTQE